MTAKKPEVIDIHTHPYFIDTVLKSDSDIDSMRKITGLLKHHPYDIRQMENKLNCAGIDKIVLHPLDITTTLNKILVTNELMSEIIKLNPQRFIGFASVDPARPDALEVLEYAFKDLGLKGLKLHPSKQRFYADEPSLEPLYRLCIKYNRPVMFHAGMSVQPDTPSKYAHPMHFEEVALRFPELRFCLAHFAWPWVQEMSMLLLKYTNVYTDTALVYFDNALEMYQKLFTQDMGRHWVDRSLRHQVLFGSDDPGLEQVRMANAVRSLDLRENTKELILGGNARVFLGEGE